MGAKYWIKLYHEILHDKKMARLTDNVWRRCIELFLLAGEYDTAGQLPNTTDIAWELRQNEETLEAELLALQAVGILQQNEAGWLVVKFTDRQDAATSTERSQQRRQRLRADDLNQRNETKQALQQINNDNATNMQRNVAPDTDTDTDTTINSSKTQSPPKAPKQPKTNGVGANAPQEIPTTPKKILMSEFQTATGLKMPSKKPQLGFWWSNIGEILDIADGDIVRGKSLISGAVDKLRREKLTIGGPESIVKTCRALAANGKGQQPQNTGTIVLPPEKREAYEELSKLYAAKSLTSADV